MSDFRPIDDKDADLEHAALVREGVEKRAGCTLLDDVDPQLLIGRWVSSAENNHDHAYDHKFKADGTCETSFAYSGPTQNTWRIEGDHFVSQFWWPPVPNQGISDPVESVVRFRCAILSDGRFAYWNGDGSVVVFLTRTSE